jgi:hypothetical protein
MGLLGNIGSAVTGISMGDFAQKALQFVGVPKSFAAGIGAMVDLKRGNVVGALQNTLEAITGTEKLGEGLKRLQGKRCAASHSCRRPSSCLGTIAKVAGFAVGGAAVAGVLGVGSIAGSLGACMSGLGKMMAVTAGCTLFAKGMGGGFAMPGLTQRGNAALHNLKKGVGYSNIDSEVAKLPPGATFEQLVHAFMKGAVKDQEEEVKGLMEKMKQQDTGSASGGGIGGFLRKITGMPLKMLGLDNLAGAATGEGSKGKESRATQMEDLKFKIQQLSQMMQALSNVNNTMHQNSMNAIRNIRA